MIRTVLLSCLFAAIGCGTNPPTPDPPAPTDVFAGAIVDCSAPEVAGESPQSEPAVRACLVGEAVAPCLVELAGRHRVDTIACVVRDLGWDENKRVLSGQLGPDSTTIDNAARSWIRERKVGYR